MNIINVLHSQTRLLSLILALAILLTACAPTSASIPVVTLEAPSAEADAFVEDAKQIATAATEPYVTWDGPTSGASAQAEKFVVNVTSDLNNGGVVGVTKGAEEAAKAIGWKFQTLDGQGSVAVQSAAMKRAISLHPDAIIVNGIDAASIADSITQANELGIKVVGWHASSTIGPVAVPPLFTNITSDPIKTSEIAAKYVIAQTNGHANVVIFTDSMYQIAVDKARAMEAEIKKCKTCKVLEFVDMPLAETSTLMEPTLSNLLKKYGDEVNWLMGINDLYFDFAESALLKSEMDKLPLSISAGDGSASAYDRIRNAQYQGATIPEPLNLHGWVAIDEINRALAGEKDSGYVLRTYLVTHSNITADGGPDNVFDPDNGYRDQYRKIWGK